MQPFFFFPHFWIVSKRILTAPQNRFNSARNSIKLNIVWTNVRKMHKSQQLPLLNVSMCEAIVVRFRKKNNNLYQTLYIPMKEKRIEAS